MGGASPTEFDLKQLSNGASGQGIHALDQSLDQNAGFSALASPTGTGKEAASLKGLSPLVRGEALVRPEEYASRSGFVAFARVTTNDIASHEVTGGAPEMGQPNGFAALQASVERGATALHGLSARQEPSQAHLQRPEGTQWSDGFQALR